MRRFTLLLCALLANGSLFAQTIVDRQLWIDADLAIPFANQYLFDTEVSYQTLVSGQEAWQSIHLTPTIQRNFTPRLDGMLSLPFYYTVQRPGYRTFEVRATPGIRYTAITGKRVELRFLMKYDFRYVKHEGQDGEYSNRFRLSFEAMIPVNRPNFFQDKMLYVITQGEGFFVADQQVNERFANVWSSKLGLGYRFNYTHRVEAIYQRQQSRVEIGQPFDTEDNIYRFRYIVFLR